MTSDHCSHGRPQKLFVGGGGGKPKKGLTWRKKWQKGPGKVKRAPFPKGGKRSKKKTHGEKVAKKTPK